MNKYSFNYFRRDRRTIVPLFIEIEEETEELAYNKAVDILYNSSKNDWNEYKEKYGIDLFVVYKENYNNLDKRGRLKK